MRHPADRGSNLELPKAPIGRQHGTPLGSPPAGPRRPVMRPARDRLVIAAAFACTSGLAWPTVVPANEREPVTRHTEQLQLAQSPAPAQRQAAPAPAPKPATRPTPESTASRTPVLKGSAGSAVRLTHDLVDMAASTGNYVIVNRAPGWVSLSPAESIGSGVWLIGPEQLRSAHLNLSAAAKGAQELSIAVVGPGGKPIAEAKLVVEAVASPAAAAPAAAPPAPAMLAVATAQAAQAPDPAPASAAPPPAATALVPSATPPAAAAPVPATPATATVAQATPPKDGTKAWTEFLKPGGQPKGPAPAPKPAQKPAGKSEAELIGYAKHLVRECTTCHSLYGQDIGIPLMVGLAKDRFLDTMELYRIGKRDNVAMQSVAQSLSEEETLALALYLGRIKPPPQSGPATSRSSVGQGGATGGAPVSVGFTVPDQPIGAGSKDLERVERWLKRGRQMLDAGEISQARLLLTRATELGDPRAALMLATSYDPNVLPWRQGMGLEAEPARAKALYQLAIRLGAGAEAERRLNELP